MTERREYLFGEKYLFGIEDHGTDMHIDFRSLSPEIAAMDMVLIAMKALYNLAEICPLAEPKIKAAIKALNLNGAYDGSGSLN